MKIVSVGYSRNLGVMVSEMVIRMSSLMINPEESFTNNFSTFGPKSIQVNSDLDIEMESIPQTAEILNLKFSSEILALPSPFK